MQFLKQSTAIDLKVGPFLDEDDGKTAEAGLTINQADVKLSKNGAVFAQKNDVTACTADGSDGWYQCPINGTDTGSLGRLQLYIHKAGALPVWCEFMIVPANIYDSFFNTTDKLEVDIAQCGGSAVAAGAIPNAAAAASGGLPTVGTGAGQVNPDGSGNVSADVKEWNGTAVAVSPTTTKPQVDAFSISDDAAAANNLEAACDGSTYNVGGGAVVAASVTGNVGGSVGSLAAQAKADVNAEVDTALNTAIPGTPTADSVNERIKAIDDKIPTNYIMGSSVQTDKDDEIDAIKAKTDLLNFTSNNVHAHTKAKDSTLPLSDQEKLDANAEVDTALNTAIPGTPTADSVNERVKAIDDKLPTGTISDFNESTDAVDLNADQSGVTVGTVSTLTGHTPQTGDNYARIGAPIGASISADIAAVQADLPQKITKNTALNNFSFLMVDSADSKTPKTGLTVTAQRSLDGAAFGACANSVTEISNGYYKINLANTDLNGDVVILKFNATGADDRGFIIVTQKT